MINIIGDVLTCVIDIKFQTSKFPNEWKISKEIPIFKKGGKADIANYIPIEIVPFFSKVIEKLFETHFDSHLKIENLLMPRQFGFLSGYSTNLVLIPLLYNIKRGIDDYFIGFVFIDFTLAFNSLVHDILFLKLQTIAIQGPPFQLINSDQKDSERTVSVLRNLSSTSVTNLGISQ